MKENYAMKMSKVVMAWNINENVSIWNIWKKKMAKSENNVENEKKSSW